MDEKKIHDEHCDCCNHDHDECDCGCDHESDVVMLQDENGNEVAFHYVYNCEYEGKEYVFLQAADDEDDSLEIFELQTVEEDGEYYDVLDPVMEDNLYDALYDKLLMAASEDCCADDDCASHNENCECHDEHCDCKHKDKK